MKRVLLVLCGLLTIWNSGCAVQPPIEESSREKLQQEREQKQSDDFARSLPQ